MVFFSVGLSSVNVHADPTSVLNHSAAKGTWKWVIGELSHWPGNVIVTCLFHVWCICVTFKFCMVPSSWILGVEGWVQPAMMCSLIGTRVCARLVVPLLILTYLLTTVSAKAQASNKSGDFVNTLATEKTWPYSVLSLFVTCSRPFVDEMLPFFIYALNVFLNLELNASVWFYFFSCVRLFSRH